MKPTQSKVWGISCNDDVGSVYVLRLTRCLHAQGSCFTNTQLVACHDFVDRSKSETAKSKDSGNDRQQQCYFSAVSSGIQVVLTR